MAPLKPFARGSEPPRPVDPPRLYRRGPVEAAVTAGRTNAVRPPPPPRLYRRGPVEAPSMKKIPTLYQRALHGFTAVAPLKPSHARPCRMSTWRPPPRLYRRGPVEAGVRSRRGNVPVRSPPRLYRRGPVEALSFAARSRMRSPPLHGFTAVAPLKPVGRRAPRRVSGPPRLYRRGPVEARLLRRRVRPSTEDPPRLYRRGPVEATSRPARSCAEHRIVPSTALPPWPR